MADTLCGPSNALQNLQKHSSLDRTLHQDRLLPGQALTQGFRSTSGPHTDIIHAEFEAFSSGQTLDLGVQEPQIFSDNGQSSFGNSGFAHISPPNWAQDFQNLHLDEAHMSPLPSSQYHRYAPAKQSTATSRHQNSLLDQSGSRASETPQSYFNSPRGFSTLPSGHIFGYPGVVSPEAYGDQLGDETTAEFDEAAFERAFDQASDENQQVDVVGSPEEALLPLADTSIIRDSPEDDRIGSDRILDDARERIQHDRVDDGDELARTAGDLLENVKADQSQKFQESTFLSLMRQLRDREIRVDGDRLVDVSQPLHPGGEFYPNDATAEVSRGGDEDAARAGGILQQRA